MKEFYFFINALVFNYFLRLFKVSKIGLKTMELEYNGYRIFLYPLLDSSLSDKEIRSFSIKNKGVNLGCAMPRLLKDRTLWNFQGKKILSLDTSGECFCFQPSSNSTWDEIPREQVEFLAIPIREYAEEDDFIGEIVYDPF